MEILLYAAVAGAVLVAGRIVVALVWRGVGLYRIRSAGPRPLRAVRHRIWRDPGPAEALDPVHGPGAPDRAPVAPFRFIQEHSSGSQPCLSVRDARGRRWRVKWGNEVRSETFAVRFASACGYFAEVTYFVPSGTIEDARNLQRTRECVDLRSGAFGDARFELDDPSVKKLFEEHSWAWDDNPFLGTAELSGLKIVPSSSTACHAGGARRATCSPTGADRWDGGARTSQPVEDGMSTASRSRRRSSSPA